MSTLSYAVGVSEETAYKSLGPWVVPVKRTFGMIKPEGIARNLVDEIERRILAAELEISAKKRLTLSVEQYDVLYGHVRFRSSKIYEPMKVHLTSRPSIVMMISGTDAVEKLLEIKGARRLFVEIPSSKFQDRSQGQIATFCLDGLYAEQFKGRYKSEFEFIHQ